MTDEAVPARPEPDDKDWTWVIERPCPDCGIDAAALGGPEIAGAIRAATAPWAAVLRRPDVRERPAPQRWSPLEYACHIRDVCILFRERTRSMLDADDPLFANWDQDAPALERRYWEADPDVVAAEIADSSDLLVQTYAAIGPSQWDRPGRRSNGSVFTVLTLGRYLVHDLAHHVWDVGA